MEDISKYLKEINHLIVNDKIKILVKLDKDLKLPRANLHIINEKITESVSSFFEIPKENVLVLSPEAEIEFIKKEN